MEVAEPQILARLQSELLKPAAADYIVKSVEREIRKALTEPKTGKNSTQRQLDAERRKLQNLIGAIEGGSDAPAALLKAVAEREATIKRLEAELRKRDERAPVTTLPDIPAWVQEQLQDLVGLLKTDPARVKSEFRRLNLQLRFNPTEAEPRPYYIVKGQCDLSALVLFYLRSRRSGAVLDSLRERSRL
jgi:hypothetical protein